MTLISNSVPGLLGGVSQQPSAVRFANQCEKSDNALANVVDGLVKRPPTKHLAKVIDGDPGAAKIHTIDRGVGERYALVLRDEDAKVFDLDDGAEIEVYDQAGNVADTADFAYLDSSDPVDDMRAVTVADYTFVLNRAKTTAMGAATYAAEEEKAFIFVQQSAYEVTYTVDIRHDSGSGQSVSLTTWDGNTSDNVAEVVRVTVGSIPTTPADTYSGSFLGQSFSATGVTGSSPANLTLSAIISAINGVSGVSAGNKTITSSTSGYFDVTGDYDGLALSTSLDTPPQGSTFTSSITTAASDTEKNSIKTTDIAEDLASQINAFSDWSASATGSTIRLLPTSPNTITKIEVSDSVGGTYMKRVWKSVPSITDLPLECEDGYIVKVEGEKSANQDDYYVKFAADGVATVGEGVWEESYKPGSVQGLDASTMPHSLVRKFDDASGTITGTPLAKYFEWGEFDWTDRVVGDTESNGDPSFVGKTIRGLFLHQNRLGLLADQNLIMSETGLYGNFFRTTVLTLVDSDPIDVGVGHTRVSLLNHAIPFNQRLYLFSDRTQFVINQNPMTPANTSIVTAAEYENSIDVGGEVSGASIYFPFNTEGYGRILELFPTGETPTSVEVIDATKHVPRYMDGEISLITASTTESLVAVTASNRPNCLFILSYFESGNQRVQSAWQRFVFGAGTTLRSASFIEEDLYLLIERDEGLFLEKMTFGSGLVDTAADFVTGLDRRIDETGLSSVTHEAGTGLSTLTLPYQVDSNEAYQVYTRAVNGKDDPFNLFSDTEDFTGSGWTVSGATVTSNSKLAPDGAKTGDTLESNELASSNVKQEIAISPTIGDSYTFSLFVRQDTEPAEARFLIDLYNISAGVVIEQLEFEVDTENGGLEIISSTTQSAAGSYTAESLDLRLYDKWIRVIGTLKFYANDGSGNAVTGARFTVHPSATDTRRSLFVWGAQLVANDHPEDYNRAAGRAFQVASASEGAITISGDVTTTPMWIGERYAMQYQFSEVNLKEGSSSQRRNIVADASYLLRHGTLLFDRTGFYRVVVVPRNREPYIHTFTGQVLGTAQNILGELELQSGRHKFAAIGKSTDLDIYIENDSPLPSNILSVEWTALYTSRSARYRA